jgi:hypothetical protein
MDNLIQCVERLQAKLDRHRRDDLKEYPTRTIFIAVMLQALGWDVTDPDEVHEEYPTIDGKSVDYALKIDERLVLFLEAKPLNDPLTDIKSITQVVGYAANAGVAWCVLTNGVMYKVYYSYAKAEAPEKLAFEVSIDPKENQGMTIRQITERLSLLSRDSMSKGILDELGKEAFATGKIKKALDKIFSNPPSTFIRLVRSKIEDDTIKPSQVKKILGKLWARAPELEVTMSSPPSVLTGATEMLALKDKTPSYEISQESIAEVDTVVVPAREDGFKEVFLGENRWYEIRIHHSLIPRIKYIAVYQVAPVSAITHWAPVKNIEPWQDSGKFVVNFAETAKEISPISLVTKSRVKALQNIRYTSFDKLQRAKTLDEVF